MITPFFVRPGEPVLTDLKQHGLAEGLSSFFPRKTHVGREVPLLFENRLSYYRHLVQHAKRVFVFAHEFNPEHEKTAALIHQACDFGQRRFRLKLL